MNMTSEFLDAPCKAGPLNRGWFLINVSGFGFFAWQTGDPETIYKIDNIDMWLEEKKLEESNPEDITSCRVRTVVLKRAKVVMPDEHNLEIWLNIAIPKTLEGKIQVEAYTDQNLALSDAEEELSNSKEVHTRRITVRVP